MSHRIRITTQWRQAYLNFVNKAKVGDAMPKQKKPTHVLARAKLKVTMTGKRMIDVEDMGPDSGLWVSFKIQVLFLSKMFTGPAE